MSSAKALLCALCLSWLLPQALARAADGYALWLGHAALPESRARALAERLQSVHLPTTTATQRLIASELRRGFAGVLGAALTEVAAPAAGSLVVGTPVSVPQLAALSAELAHLGPEGFLLRTTRLGGQPVTVIAANTDVGALYGSFHLLRLLHTDTLPARLDVRASPALRLRVLNHWDNLDGTVERGYAGFSLWDWHKLPDWLDPRYADYARANASIGINGAVLNNVNSNALVLTPAYLDKVAALAGVFRPYGIKVYLSARFSAPKEIGGLATADPLESAVQAWWAETVSAIYQRIPDFGGFLVKANSEGQPGPQDYGRSHAEGANMLARALKPHGGVVMWRAFVYSHEQPDDRAKQAYAEFMPLDGQFDDNVLLQVKNGAIDFQPREPFHPLFGAMRKTPLMMEFQITKEYLGFATHLAYLGTLYEETLAADTRVAGKGATVRRVLTGHVHPQQLTGIAGVANIGSDRNWTGSHFDQANWYAFGRLAWDPALRADDIATEWVQQTFGRMPALVAAIVGMMRGSRQAVVDYMTPLGLHHLMGEGHHYGPGPWVQGGPRADWTAVYYHRADAQGLGFDRSRTGSNAVAQYAPAVARVYSDPRRVPEDLLLWFHHLPWDWRTASGRPLWTELVTRYDRGVARVAGMRATWAGLEAQIDPERFAQVAAFLAIQHKEAQWWRDASIAYWQRLHGKPLPAGHAAPPHSLEHYKALRFPHAPGHW